MSYTVTLTDGTVLTTIADATVDNTSSLTLIGHNYPGYGQYIANDFVHMLENFSNTTSPPNPLTGQFWYDSTTGLMNIYNGTSWSPIAPNPEAPVSFDNPSAPSNDRLWQIVVSNSGLLEFQSLNDNLTIKNTVLSLDGTGSLLVGNMTVGGALSGTLPNPTLASSIALTGVPTAPTASPGTNTTQIATTAYVAANTLLILQSNLILYVATTGSDSNPGTSGSPFLTVQHAINVALQNYDCNAGQYTITINVAAGTYTQALTVTAPIAGGNQMSLIINGASSSTVNLNSGSSTTTLTSVGTGTGITVQNVTFSGGAAQSLNADQNGYIAIGTGVVFASAISAHIFGTNGGVITRLANYTITGSPASHIAMTGGARLYSSGALVVTLTGTPSFSAEFVGATSLALVNDSAGVTYSGSATGTKFSVTSNAVILSAGGTSGVNYPGNAGGTNTTGGQII